MRTRNTYIETKWTSLVLIALVVMLGVGAHAANPSTEPTASATPATQPSDELWQNTVTAFAAALVNPETDPRLDGAIDETTNIHQFSRTQRDSILALHRKMSGLSIIAAHAYRGAPTSLASELLSDAHDQVGLPDELKKQFTPSDDEATQRANLTASKWVATSLSSSASDPVGVIVLWQRVSRPDGGESQSNFVPVFVLVRGEITDGKCHITQICYGDPTMMASSSTDSNSAATSSSGN